jgi:8-oxo-dGTP pyrophosphatase MutT (NUDIX family)
VDESVTDPAGFSSNRNRCLTPLALETTWDGLPVAPERPFACAIVVWREVEGRREFLVLHRLAVGGRGFEGDWAWTPPSGARQPGEEPDAAAARELLEEIGLALPLTALPGLSATDDIALYVAQARADVGVVLDDENDDCRWLPLADALSLCLPAVVAEGLANAAAWLDGS